MNKISDAGTYSVSVIVPVYNEYLLIEDAVRKINSFLENKFADYEIIVVESCSTDGTKEICDKLKEMERVTVINESGRNGIGSAIKIGIDAFSKDLFLVMTADLPYRIESLLEAVKHLDRNDVVFSYRSEDTRKDYYRKFQSFIYNSLVKIILGLQVKHVNSAFKLFKKDVIKNMRLDSNIGFIDTEMVFRVTHSGISYTEIPVPLIDRESGTSSITTSTTMQFVKELAGFFVKNRVSGRSNEKLQN